MVPAIGIRTEVGVGNTSVGTTVEVATGGRDVEVNVGAIKVGTGVEVFVEVGSGEAVEAAGWVGDDVGASVAVEATEVGDGTAPRNWSAPIS